MSKYHDLAEPCTSKTPRSPHKAESGLLSARTDTSLPLVKDSAVSPQALALFRLLERLSRRSGYACVKLLETLAAMFERSLRATRYALAELLAVGWIARTQTRKSGVSKLFFRPLVRVAGCSRGLFSCQPVAGCFAGYSPSKLQVTPSAPIKTAPVGKGDDNTGRNADRSQNACPVAVSLLKEVCSETEALELAREATRHQLTEGQVKRVLEAYKGQLANIRNRGAWLREALRRGFSPAAPLSTHASDQGGAPVAKMVRIPKDRPFWGGATKLQDTQSQTAPGNTPVASQETILSTSGAPTGIDILRAKIAAKKAGLA